MSGSGRAARLRRPLRPLVRLAVRLVLARPLLHRVARAVYRRVSLLHALRASPAPAVEPAALQPPPAPADPNAPYTFHAGAARAPMDGPLTVEDLFHLSRVL